MTSEWLLQVVVSVELTATWQLLGNQHWLGERGKEVRGELFLLGFREWFFRVLQHGGKMIGSFIHALHFQANICKPVAEFVDSSLRSLVCFLEVVDSGKGTLVFLLESIDSGQSSGQGGSEIIGYFRHLHLVWKDCFFNS